MKGAGPVLIYGDVAPHDYIDFSAMLESALAPLRGRTPELHLEVQSMRLRSYIARYAQERGYFYAAHNRESPVSPVLQIAFLNPAMLRTFDFGHYPTVEQKPVILLVSPHGSSYT